MPTPKTTYRSCRPLCAVVLVSGALLFASSASAQSAPVAPQPAPAAPPVAKAAPSAADVEQARVHFERGQQLYKEESLEAALYELERAYELAPSYRILYNIGIVLRQQNNYAAALGSFQRYLAEGGSNVSEERRKEVEGEIETLKTRVATVTVTVNVAGADILLDDAPACGVGKPCKSPLAAPLVVNPGRHTVSAQKTGYTAASTSLRVVGADVTTALIDLLPVARAPVGPVAYDPAPRTRSIVAWASTGALAAGAIVTGALTLDAKSRLNADLNTPNVTSSQLDSDARKVKGLALGSDILTGAAIAGGVVAVFFTVKASQANGEPGPQREQATALRFDVGPRGATLGGAF